MSYRFIPQKKRSKLRVKLGVFCYCLLRFFLWIRYSSRFAKKSKAVNIEDFNYLVFQHESPLRRKLSKVDFELQEGKIANLKIASKCVTEVVIKPNEIFSYWRLIGNPTKFRGFKKGMMLVNGKPTSAIGGGLCALSNLIYWMTLHTPLTVVERFRHSYDVFPDSNRTLPFGSGATCVYNYRDLMILNETENTFLLKVYVDEKNGILKGEWRSKNPVFDEYEVYQKDHWITHEITNAYVRHNTIYRKHFTTQNGTKILTSDDLLVENHALMMYEPLLE